MAPQRFRRWLAIAMLVLTGLWMVGVTVITHAVGWLFGEALNEVERPVPAWLWPTVAWLPALLAALPAFLLARLSKVDFARRTGRGWTVAALAGGLLGTVRLISPAYHEVYLAVLALVAAAVAVVPVGRKRIADRPDPALEHGGDAPGGHTPVGHTPVGHTLLGLAAGLATLVPWLWVGALGGLVETGLAACAALAIGWLASRRLAMLLRVGERIRNRWVRTITTGLVMGVALLGLAAGIGQPGIEILALIALPPVGFLAAALSRPLFQPQPLLQPQPLFQSLSQPLGSRGTAFLTALVGAAAFGPLAFVDPEEVSLVLGTEDVGFWALVAAAGSLGVALLLTIPYTAIFAGGAVAMHRRIAAMVAGAVAAAAAIVYIGLGHPGLYGEHVFVVMKQQADLSGLDTIGNRDDRVRQTYRRLVDTAARSQSALRRELRARGLGFRSYYLINGIEVDGGQVVRAWLAQRGDVDRVLLNPELRPIPRAAGVLHGSESAPSSPQWNLTALGADRVWRDLGVTGTGIVVGGSDSGVDGTHPALRGNFRGDDDSWLDPSGDERQPIDHNGHGTHTLATAVGAAVGVAPGAQWVGCVNLPRNLGNPASYLTCMQFMLAPYPPGGDPMHDGRPERAPQVLTNSWGCPELEGCDRGALRQAVAGLTAAGIYFVAAAGNSGPFCGSVQDPPATYPDTLTVGAVDQGDNLTDFSSRGPAPGGLAKPDVVAPGAHILSALPGGGYGYLDGTSMATPHVAGVVALMWSANPKLIGDISRTTAILRGTAKPARVPRDACGGNQDSIGAGMIDAYAAVQAARTTA